MARGLLRATGRHAAVSNLELFFDLVYVFAITQISQFIRARLDWSGLAEAALMFLAVWWAWIYTSWATNWANPDTVPVRLMLIATMLASLIMAAALPHAFDGGEQALVFALAYAAVQLGRTLFMVWAMAQENRSGSRNLLRIACWFAVSAPLWIVGALVAGRGLQFALWGAALAIEYAGPVFSFRFPGLGRSTMADWDISGRHMAERASLFVLIALGEGIVVTGTTFAERAPDGPRVLAMLAAFGTSVLMWWIYFDTGAERGARHITQSGDVGRVARDAYTYAHLPIIASVVAEAVADAMLMAAPDAIATPALIAATGGALVGFLGGLALFKRFFSLRGLLPLSHIVGLVLLGALLVSARWVAWRAIGFAGACCLVLLIVAVWEWGSFHGGWRERFVRWGVPGFS